MGAGEGRGQAGRQGRQGLRSNPWMQTMLPPQSCDDQAMHPSPLSLPANGPGPPAPPPLDPAPLPAAPPAAEPPAPAAAAPRQCAPRAAPALARQGGAAAQAYATWVQQLHTRAPPPGLADRQRVGRALLQAPPPPHLFSVQALQVRQGGHHKGSVAGPAGAGVAQQVELLQLLVLPQAAGRAAAGRQWGAGM